MMRLKRIGRTFGIAILFSALLIAACRKDSGGAAGSLPTLSIGNVKQERSVVNTIFPFEVTLSAPAAKDVSVRYATVASTAKAQTDFIPVSGILTITAGQVKATISVTVIGDSLRQENQNFGVRLEQPQNTTLQNDIGYATIVNENGTYLPVDNSGYTTPAQHPGYALVWSDEFEGRSLNNANWTPEQGGNGWGNKELQYYTDRVQNAFVTSGKLVIEARAESYGGNRYTSARLISKQKRAFRFGRIDIRARLPKTKGIWPALWMLGSNFDAVGWPACGEIDIMELLGHEPSKVYHAVHYGSSPAVHQSRSGSYVLPGEGFDEKFHVFSLLWEEDKMTFLVDEKETFSLTRGNLGSPYPFNNEFFFLFNIAVGGNWPGEPDATTRLPQRMFVDYIRVFQK